MAVSDLTLDLLGTSFTISVDEDPAYLQEILARYREALETTKNQFNLKDPLITAMLTGFLLSDDLHKLQNQTADQYSVTQDEAQEAEKLALSIMARIDSVIKDKSPGKA